mmetsp:Transcript_119132/g.297228  ORF Transcript_119132/g.297228 Transcript_119132/m.297228 type:complete len:204 (-) Transcript_119132:232-843(-)
MLFERLGVKRAGCWVDEVGDHAFRCSGHQEQWGACAAVLRTCPLFACPRAQVVEACRIPLQAPAMGGLCFQVLRLLAFALVIYCPRVHRRPEDPWRHCIIRNLVGAEERACLRVWALLLLEVGTVSTCVRCHQSLDIVEPTGAEADRCGAVATANLDRQRPRFQEECNAVHQLQALAHTEHLFRRFAYDLLEKLLWTPFEDRQ